MNIDVATYALKHAHSFEANQLQQLGGADDGDRTVSSKTDQTPTTKDDNASQSLTPPATNTPTAAQTLMDSGHSEDKKNTPQKVQEPATKEIKSNFAQDLARMKEM